MMAITPKAARINAGLSRKQCADALNIALSTYINKERGLTDFSKPEATAFSKIVNLPENEIDFLWLDRSTKEKR